MKAIMKRQYIYIVLLLSLILVSCGGEEGGSGGSGGSGVNPPEPNTAPSVPNQVFPLDNTICIDENVMFEWNASTDAEGDAITYRIEVSENPSFVPIARNESSITQSMIISLQKGRAYYWRLKAVDNKSESSSYSPTQQFVTEGEGTTNHVPFAATFTSPTNNSEIDGTSVTIKWFATDVDNDSLTFDVYMDINENPSTKVSSDQTESSYTDTELSTATTYYIKVVTKDNKGSSSTSQVMSFTTK